MIPSILQASAGQYTLPPVCFVSGTDTDAGKTFVTAALCLAAGYAYWKPVQAGTQPETDTEAVIRLTGGQVHTHPEAARLNLPASPHLAAAAEGLTLQPETWHIPPARPLLIEGAGGLLVPLRHDLLLADWIARTGLPLLLVVHTRLGCINHTLLSLEAARSRGIPLAGIVLNEGGQTHSLDVLAYHAPEVPVIGYVPDLRQQAAPLTREQARSFFPALG